MTSPASWISEVGSRADSQTDLRIEPVARESASALEALFVRNAASASGFDPFPLDAATARAIALEPRRDLYFIAVGAAGAVGFSMLRGFDEGYAIPSFGIFIDAGHRGRGLGKQLTAWTVQQARDRGCPAVRLSVYSSNRTALALYSSLGFVERARHPIERGDAAEEKIIMVLEFET